MIAMEGGYGGLMMVGGSIAAWLWWLRAGYQHIPGYKPLLLLNIHPRTSIAGEIYALLPRGYYLFFARILTVNKPALG
jgi:hypothetical protein